MDDVKKDVFIVNNAAGAVLRDERVPSVVIEQYYECLDGEELDQASDKWWIFPVYTYFGRRILLGLSFPVKKMKNAVCCGLAFADRDIYKGVRAARRAVLGYIKEINKKKG